MGPQNGVFIVGYNLDQTAFFIDGVGPGTGSVRKAADLDWVVQIKPVGDGYAVLKYLAPYLFRVAISNKRIISCKNDQVSFCYRDRESSENKIMILYVFEFLRRFFQHVLPKGFQKIHILRPGSTTAFRLTLSSQLRSRIFGTFLS
ncbi:MAG: transposase [Acidobacteria bacterium]|nr:transposase [Acidobacteriota bacterium]MBU4307348.1 transposase [Acidobacteriota bacterium]